MRTPSVRPSPSNSPVRYTPPSSPMRHTFSDSLNEENIDIAESMIAKWDPKVKTQLFTDNRYEAKQFLNSIKNLQAAMHYFLNHHSTSDKLVRAQGFMQIAMKRLQKEFYDILSTKRHYLNHDSVSSHLSRSSTRSSSVSSDYDDDDFTFSRESSPDSNSSTLVTADLKAIADCMISSGYGKECVEIYKIVRKSTVDEALYHLGMDWSVLNSQAIQKMDWDVLEGKVASWLKAVKVSVRTVFYGERILCDHVFSSSLPVQQACFQEITRTSALELLGFPETVAKNKKLLLSPEKMFRILDMYDAITNLWPEIDSIFSFESTAAVRSQAVNSLVRLREAASSMLAGFEAAIEKDGSKMAVPGGGVHPLTRYVMNYLTFLADYGDILGDVFVDWAPPKAALAHLTELPEDGLPLIARLTWLILLLLCKLDGKAKLYKDVALSYIFMANNLHYVVHKVVHSNLKYLLGEDWVLGHEAKVKQYIGNYEKMAWSKVINELPIDDPTADIALGQVIEIFRRFNLGFEEAYQKQKTWVVWDPKMRGKIRETLAKKLGPGYGVLYKRYGVGLRRDAFRESIVRFTPEDLENYVSDLFHESGPTGSVSSSGSSYSGHSDKGRGRH